MIKKRIYLKSQGELNFRRVLSFLSPRALQGVEIVSSDSFCRTFGLGNSTLSRGYLEARADKGGVELTVCFPSIHRQNREPEDSLIRELAERVSGLFDLNRDMEPIESHLGQDPHLAKAIRNGGVPRLPAAFNVFEFMVRAVLGQQITVKAATTLAGRIARRAGLAVPENEDFPPGLECFFPGPESLTDLDLEGLGITRTRQETVRTVTQAVLEGQVSLDRNQSYKAFYADFTALKGIGEWTAAYVAMRGLGLADSFPASDLGIIKALSPPGEKLSVKEIEKTARVWSPYRAYAALCLWEGLSL